MKRKCRSYGKIYTNERKEIRPMEGGKSFFVQHNFLFSLMKFQILCNLTLCFFLMVEIKHG
jgi:hypothetical protein